MYISQLGIRFWLNLNHIYMILRVSWPLLVPLVEYLSQEVASPFHLHYLHPRLVYSPISLVFGLASLVLNSLLQLYLLCLMSS